MRQEQVQALLNSFDVAVEFDRPKLVPTLEALLARKQHVFTFADGKGLMLVEIRAGANKRRMSILAFHAPNETGQRIRKLVKALKRLAADWACDTVETVCYDPRLASAIVKVGGRVESVNVILPV